MSAVPPTFATAAAFAFAATSPVSGVSGVCAGLGAGVVPGVVPVVAALAACARWPLPANATAAPTSATAASARAPPALLQSLFLMTSFQGGFLHLPSQHANLGVPWESPVSARGYVIVKTPFI